MWFEGSAADLSLLTDEIKGARFSGHIVLEFQESLDFVLVARGEFIKVLEKIGRRIMTTRKYREIWGKCQIKQGKMYVFEIPPSLVRSMTGMSRRRQVLGDTRNVAEFDEAVRSRRGNPASGFIDGRSGTGKILIEFRDTAIHGCYYTEYQGLSYRSYDAFVRWHESIQSGVPYTLHVSDFDETTDNTHLWEQFLTEGIDDVEFPMKPGDDRLYGSFGIEVQAGDRIFAEDVRSEQAYYVLDGTVELSRLCGGKEQILGYLGKGSILGLSWLNGQRPPPLSGSAFSDCRLLAFDRAQLDRILFNDPALASSVIMKSVAQLAGIRRRRELFVQNPRLKDLESYVVQVLNREPERIRSGLPPGDLFRELTQVAPFSLPEMDQMVRSLVSAGRIVMNSGRVILQPEEI